MSSKLNERDSEILKILIADYIATADPIGSRTISKKIPSHLSPATIRNVMSDLTELGYLTQPHTSAGRIPTNAGLRYYVDTLLTRRELSDEEMEDIRSHCLGNEKGIGTVLTRATRILASVSHYVGLVVTPRADRIKFKRIEFVPLSRNKVLGIFVSQEGVVENRLIDVGEELMYPDLEKMANFCNQSFVGHTLEEALERIRRELLTERADYDMVLKKALLYSEQILNGVSHSDLVFDGEKQLLNEPEFSEVDKFKKVLAAFEEKTRLLHLLEHCRDGDGVQIFIGSDAKLEGMDCLSLVAAPYFKDGKVVGAMGVIGPTRMDYSSVVPVVDFTAKVIGDAMEI